MYEDIFPDLSFLVKQRNLFLYSPGWLRCLWVRNMLSLELSAVKFLWETARREVWDHQACKCVTLFSKACLTHTGTKQQLGKRNISLPRGCFFGKLGFHQWCHDIQQVALVRVGSWLKDWLKKSLFFVGTRGFFGPKAWKKLDFFFFSTNRLSPKWFPAG